MKGILYLIFFFSNLIILKGQIPNGCDQKITTKILTFEKIT